MTARRFAATVVAPAHDRSAVPAVVGGPEHRLEVDPGAGSPMGSGRSGYPGVSTADSKTASAPTGR